MGIAPIWIDKQRYVAVLWMINESERFSWIPNQSRRTTDVQFDTIPYLHVELQFKMPENENQVYRSPNIIFYGAQQYIEINFE